MLSLQDEYNTCALSKHIGKYVYSARNAGKGSAKRFPPFLSLIHILPICFDSAHVLYMYLFFCRWVFYSGFGLDMFQYNTNLCIMSWLYKISHYLERVKEHLHVQRDEKSDAFVERFDHMMFVCRFQASQWSKPQRKKLLCG
jgi:hypothetical protein